MKKLSVQLKQWQKQKQLTQREAALLLGVGRGTYESWLYGERVPSRFALTALLAKIGTTILLEKEYVSKYGKKPK